MYSMHNLHARTQPWASQFEDQSCECAERGLIVEDDCECCQNDGGSFESQRHQMNPINLCKDCPQLYPASPPWRRLQEEHSSSSRNHLDLGFGQSNDSDKDNDEDDDDNFPGGDEDCDDRSDDIGDDDDCDDNSNNNDEEDSDMDMEVDDDFRKFLEQSEKHRQEREQSKLSSTCNCLRPKVNSFGFLSVILIKYTGGED